MSSSTSDIRGARGPRFSVFDRAAVGLSEISLDGRFQRVNDELCRMLDRPREQLLRLSLADVTHPEDLPRSKEALRRVVETDSRESLDKRYLQPDGSIVHANSILTRLDDEGGRPEAVLAVTADLTQRLKTEQELREAKAALERDLTNMRRLHRVSTQLISEHDLDAVLDEILDAALTVARCDRGNIQLLDRSTGNLNLVSQRGFSRRTLDEIGALTLESSSACAESLRRNERVVVPHVESSKHIEPRIAQAFVRTGIRALQCTPMPSRSSEMIGVITTHFDAPRELTEREQRVIDLLARQAADIIDRLRSEEALRRSEHRFRELANAMPQLVWTASPSGEVEYYNSRVAEYDGCERRPDGTWRWKAVVHPDDAERTVTEWNRAWITGRTYSIEHRIRMANGSNRWHLSRAQPLVESGEIVKWFGTATDIHDLKVAEAAVRRSEERYRTLVSQVQDYAIFHTDPRGVTTTWNEGCEAVLGYTREEFIGLDSALLFTPEDRVAGVPQRELEQAAKSGSAGSDRWMVTKDDRHFFASETTSAIYDETGVIAGYTKVLRDQSEMKRTQDELSQHRDNLEQLVEQRTVELEQTYKQLRMSERMASIGTLSAGLGHDMGNLLLPVNVRLEALKEAELPEEHQQHVEVIATSARYLQDLSKGLRMLATDPTTTQVRGNISVKKWWSAASRVLSNVLPGHVQLQHRMPEQDCRVAINRAALTQAVFNLVQNAGDAMQNRDVGSVTVWAEGGGDIVTIGVTDDGPGMTEEVKRRCMDAYFSTKTRGISTGMGLAFVQGLVAGVGGRIELESAPGEGTTFRLILPAAPPRKAKPLSQARKALVDILDARLKAMVHREVHALGFRIVATDDPGEGDPTLIIVDAQAFQAHVRFRRAKNALVAVIGETMPSNSRDHTTRVAHLGDTRKPSELRARLRQLAEQIPPEQRKADD